MYIYTLFPKRIWNKVGELDHKRVPNYALPVTSVGYITGQSDA